METLLAIINDPKEAKSFIGYVAHMVQDLNLKAHLMYVQEPYDYTLGQPPSASYSASVEVQKKNAEEAEEYLAKLIGEIHSEIPGDFSMYFSTEVADISVVINDYVSSKRANMVILEAAEQKSFWTFASSYFDVIERVNCPVWIIPFSTQYKPVREIVYATDYKEEDVETLKKLVGLTFSLSPSITALHICDSVDFEEKVRTTGFNEMVQTKTGYKNIAVKCMVEKDNQKASHLINEYALEVSADLIVVLKENKSFFDRIFSPDSTTKIVKEAELPVLVYKFPG